MARRPEPGLPSLAAPLLSAGSFFAGQGLLWRRLLARVDRFSPVKTLLEYPFLLLPAGFIQRRLQPVAGPAGGLFFRPVCFSRQAPPAERHGPPFHAPGDPGGPRDGSFLRQ